MPFLLFSDFLLNPSLPKWLMMKTNDHLKASSSSFIKFLGAEGKHDKCLQYHQSDIVSIEQPNSGHLCFNVEEMNAG